jgi:hypothetical protein
LHQPSQAVQAEAAAGALGVAPLGEDEGDLQESTTSSPHSGVDLEGQLLAVDDLDDDEEEDEEGELDGDQPEEPVQERRRSSVEMDEDEEEGDEGDMNMSTEDTEGVDASDDPGGGDGASDETNFNGRLLHNKLFARRSPPRYTQANSERR